MLSTNSKSPSPGLIPAPPYCVELVIIPCIRRNRSASDKGSAPSAISLSS